MALGNPGSPTWTPQVPLFNTWQLSRKVGLLLRESALRLRVADASTAAMAPAGQARLDARFFDSAYGDAGICPLWDLGRPARQLVRLERTREIGSHVLDVGCGTGDNSLYLAERGYRVTGIDFAASAIDQAKEKADSRHLESDFRVHDVFRLASLGRTFDTIIDFGLLHVLPTKTWPRLVAGLAAALKPGANYHLLCFSDAEPEWGGPQRMARRVIEDLFHDWEIYRLRPARFAQRLPGDSHKAWLMSARRPARLKRT